MRFGRRNLRWSYGIRPMRYPLDSGSPSSVEWSVPALAAVVGCRTPKPSKAANHSRHLPWQPGYRPNHRESADARLNAASRWALNGAWGGSHAMVAARIAARQQALPAEKSDCIATHLYSSITNGNSRNHGGTQIHQTRNADYAGAVGSGSGLHSGDSRGLSQAGYAFLYHRADDGLPAGGEESRPAGQEDRQCTYFRGGGVAQRRAAQADRRSAGLLRGPHATNYGAPRRIR